MKEILGEKCYTVEEAAQILGIGKQTLQVMYRTAGKPKTFLLSRTVYISEGSLREFIAGTEGINTKPKRRKKDETPF